MFQLLFTKYSSSAFMVTLIKHMFLKILIICQLAALQFLHSLKIIKF